MVKNKHSHIIIIAVVFYTVLHLAHSYCFDFDGKVDRERNTWYLNLAGILLFYGLSFYAIRRKQKSNTSFKNLIKAGVTIAFCGILLGNVLDQLYYRSLSKTSRTHVVDHLVDQGIKNYEGSNLDIFKIEQNTLDLFKWGTAALNVFFTFLLHFLFVIIFALIFGVKDKRVPKLL